MPRGFVGPEINQPDKPSPLLVARDPGDMEVVKGKPLVGPSGSVLFGGYDRYTDRQIGGAVEHAGLVREDFNITNRVLRHPWNNEFHRHSWEDINDGKRQLFRLIEELQPSIIIATGAQAAYDLIPNWATLTDRKPGDFSGGKDIKGAKAVLDRRGYLWYPEEHELPCECPVLVTIHPAVCLYQPMPHRLMLDIDFQRAGAVLRGELPRRAWPDFRRIRTKADLAPLWDAELTAYDIEVKWGGAEFLCIAFYSNDGQGFLAYSDGFKACEEFLRSDHPKLCHNGQFDRYFLETRMGVSVGGHHEDSIVGHWACYPELAGKEDTGREDQKKKTKSTMTRKGLNFLGSFHLNVPWWKTYTSDPALMGRLCVNDVAATMWSWEVIAPEIDAMGVQWQYYRQLQKIPALMKTQQRGMLIDEPMRKARMKELSTRHDSLYGESKDAATEFLQAIEATHKPDGKEYGWFHAAQCTCCGGGSIKREHCPKCAKLKGTGAGGSIKKTDLALWLWRKTKNKPAIDKLSKAEMVEFIPPCKACDGTGKVPKWDFNPMSGPQLISLLWTHLGVPKYTYGSGDADASEETIRKVLEWAEEESDG